MFSSFQYGGQFPGWSPLGIILCYFALRKQQGVKKIISGISGIFELVESEINYTNTIRVSKSFQYDHQCPRWPPRSTIIFVKNDNVINNNWTICMFSIWPPYSKMATMGYYSEILFFAFEMAAEGQKHGFRNKWHILSLNNANFILLLIIIISEVIMLRYFQNGHNFQR